MISGPLTIALAPKASVSIRWTKRAHYRLDSLGERRARIQDTRDGSGFAFLCQHIWAMLDRESERRRYATPEDIAAVVDEHDATALHAAWRAVWLEAYEIDIDKPEPAPEAKEAGAPANPPSPTAPPSPSTGLAR
jgi:hypothetical protein